MKTQKYIVTIEMPDGDMISPGWIKDLLEADCDVEDIGRHKVSVGELMLDVKLSNEILERYYYDNFAFISSAHTPTLEILRDIAEHFYEIGQIDAANKYDEIENNRQRAEEESLGKTLDEAARAYLLNEHCSPLNRLMHQVGVKIEMSYHKDIEVAFKAGAEWMAGQGVSWEDEMTYYDGFLLYGKDERAFTMEGNFNEGDKVIVQIRKKED